MNLRFVLLLAGALALTSCASKESRTAAPSASPPQKVFRTTNERADTFMINDPDCSISFVIESARDGKSLRIRDLCPRDRANRFEDYGLILQDVLSVTPKESIARVYSTDFYDLKFWEEDIAVAASSSLKWREFRKNKKRFEVPNKVFVEIFNDNGIGADLRDVFRRQGLELQLVSVEKVMTWPANKLAFAKDYPALKSSKRRIPFSAGVYSFSVRSL